jgi:hypothetical protein
MLRQFSRRARLEALLHDGTRPGMKEFSSILNSSAESPRHTSSTSLTPIEAAEVLAQAPKLDDREYGSLLQYLQHTGRLFRHWNDLPHPVNSNVLPTHARRPLQIHQGEHTFSCQRSHRGNSAIYFYNPLTHSHATGFIEIIWQLPLEATLKTFIIIRPHRVLPVQEEERAPFINYPGFKARIFDSQPSDDSELVIIEPHHILTHLTTFQRPAGTYGIDRETLVVCLALDRGRK